MKEQYKFKDLEKKYENFYAPIYRIFVSGKDLLAERVEVFSVNVNNTLDGADDFSFTVNNYFDVHKDRFPLLEKGGVLEVGKEVEIKVGYKDKKGLKTVFMGTISSVDVSFPANGISQLTVKGYDYSHQMMKAKHSQTWGSSEKPIRYSDIVKEVVSKQRFKLGTKNVENTREQHPQVKQDQRSDFDFIKNDLASRIGFEVFVFEKDFYFRPPASNKDEVITTLEWGKSLISFSPEINIANQVSEVEVRGWDPKQQKAIVGKAKKGDEYGREGGRKSGGDLVASAQGEVVYHVWRPVYNEKEAKDIAKSILDKISQGLVKGNAECIGIPDILPGKNINLGGFGKKFSKPYYIEKTTHSISSSGYKTTFSVKESTI
jgi:phage protein D